MTLLLVEDDTEISDMMRDYLMVEGYEIINLYLDYGSKGEIYSIFLTRI